MRYCVQTVAGRDRGKRSRSTHPRPSVALGGRVRVSAYFSLRNFDGFGLFLFFGFLISTKLRFSNFKVLEFGIFRQIGGAYSWHDLLLSLPPGFRGAPRRRYRLRPWSVALKLAI